MSVGLGILKHDGILGCDDNHQIIYYFWDVYTGYECPICNLEDPEEYAEEMNEELIKELSDLKDSHKRLQHKIKPIINLLKEKIEEEEYFDEDIKDETKKES